MAQYEAKVRVSIDEEIDLEQLKSRLETIMLLTVDEDEPSPDGLAVEIDWESLTPIEGATHEAGD